MLAGTTSGQPTAERARGEQNQLAGPGRVRCPACDPDSFRGQAARADRTSVIVGQAWLVARTAQCRTDKISEIPLPAGHSGGARVRALSHRGLGTERCSEQRPATVVRRTFHPDRGVPFVPERHRDPGGRPIWSDSRARSGSDPLHRGMASDPTSRGCNSYLARAATQPGSCPIDVCARLAVRSRERVGSGGRTMGHPFGRRRLGRTRPSRTRSSSDPAERSGGVGRERRLVPQRMTDGTRQARGN